MQAFAREALRPDGGFLASFLPFVERIARLGVQNSLVQTALKLTAPGVPDIYQGCELWDLSVVDPDNRRAVDHRERNAAIAELAPLLQPEKERAAVLRPGVTGGSSSPRRRFCSRSGATTPSFFAEGGYQPIETTGEDADWVVGFVRAAGQRRLAVLAARFPALREEKPDWQCGRRFGGRMVRPCSRSAVRRRYVLA